MKWLLLAATVGIAVVSTFLYLDADRQLREWQNRVNERPWNDALDAW
jgi:hypothetical protein